MKINRVIDGKYSEIKLEDGKKIFLSVLPDRITASNMVLFIPTKKIWEFIFPFYIRTAVEAWESSKKILNIVLETIKEVRNLTELKNVLESETNKALREYTKERGEEAREISVDKVGMHALKQMLNPKGLQKIENIIHEFGKILEITGQETMSKYPAVVYPQSLLPYPKEEIRKAIQEAQRYINDEKEKEQMRICGALLDSFIDDEEANKKNSEMLKILSDTKNALGKIKNYNEE